ncbi:hypothetical protein [Acinetobacter baumannii]|uniref:hypothetical protein n=1 Tax=Acinetobacter baumannii TaxID=470 RepID=UPI00240589FF|nr:hypothetical protein [Acinetobacter baumannii]MDF9437067.1 hypothetical protein [Acinetobacter baumannii]MDP7840857.1 hypothetical protein [Acinetobacter baumannii]MDP7863518.1 hypothetical protein [Acinetobacter baumannii]HAV3446263.1 hypothetical protein [Acinetobacter baumannii]HAV3465531.1 hypothetical protein [Acinetobacter baumannii]
MKQLFSLLILLVANSVHAEPTPFQRLLLINDLETWLSKGKSLFNWTGVLNNQINENSSYMSPSLIYADYANNIFKAESRYDGKIQGIYGPFNNIEKSDDGSPVIVFNVSYANRLYVTGPSVKEVLSLNLGTPVKMKCLNFKLSSSGDLKANCSFFTNTNRLIAVNTIQNRNYSQKVNQVISKYNDMFKQVDLKIKKEIINEINSKCSFIDSTNYDQCIELIHKSIK